MLNNDSLTLKKVSKMNAPRYNPVSSLIKKPHECTNFVAYSTGFSTSGILALDGKN